MQNNKKLTDILTRPLPQEALKKHPSRSYLTTINPIYVTDRLNEAFGVGGWNFNPEVVDDNTNPKMIIVRGTLTADKHNIKVIQFGGNDNDDRGDAYKGASTDALTKCASYLGVGAEVWRNGKPAEVETAPAGKPPELIDSIRKVFRKRYIKDIGKVGTVEHKENLLNHWLKFRDIIETNQTYNDLKPRQLDDFMGNWGAFIKNVKKLHAKRFDETPSDKTTK